MIGPGAVRLVGDERAEWSTCIETSEVPHPRQEQMKLTYRVGSGGGGSRDEDPLRRNV